MLKNILRINKYQNSLHNFQKFQITTIPKIPIFEQATLNFEKTGIINQKQQHFTNQNLLETSFYLANQIEKLLENSKQDKKKISILLPPGENYVYSFYATWMLQNCVVPIHYTFPFNEVDYRIKDSSSEILITTRDQINELGLEKQEIEQIQNKQNNLKVIYIEDFIQQQNKEIKNKEQFIFEEQYEEKQDALIIYTSGTTGRPKGAVHTHVGLNKQYKMLIDSWKWTNQDRFLNVLPLHHIHGLVVGFLTCQAAGACTEFMQFDSQKIWDHFTNENISVFMAVPTIYVKMIEYYKKQSIDQQKKYTENVKKLRLMVSGSAALPPEIFQEFYDITGQKILERFGMTEIAMAITNDYDDPNKRVIGSVGKPFPNSGIEVEIRNLETQKECEVNVQGDLLVKTPTMFKEYLNLPEKTKSEFTEDGFFITGDTAVVDENGYYYIRGRTSVDIIKSSGYKISALEIENILLKNPEIKEIAIVGIEDRTYGQIIGAMVVRNNLLNINNEEFSIQLQQWCKKQMSNYKVPRVIKYIDQIPRNQMQKINKKELLKTYFSE